MTRFPTAYVPDSLRDADPLLSDHLLAHGLLLTREPGDADVVVAIAGADLSAARAVGAGVVALVGESDVAAGALAAVGVRVQPAGRPAEVRVIVPTDPGRSAPGVDLLAWTTAPRLPVTATLCVEPPAVAALRPSGPVGDRRTRLPVLAATADGADGRVVALGVDVLGGDGGAELLLNSLTWAARPVATAAAPSAADPVAGLAQVPAWLRLKSAVAEMQRLQGPDGSVPHLEDLPRARELVFSIVAAVDELAPAFPHDAPYLEAVTTDFARWLDGGLGVPDFLDSLVAFHPERARVDGLAHLVVFPMYTQNGSPDRHLEAVLLRVLWPDFVAELEADEFSNALFVPSTFIDFTSGYDTNSAVLFPETVATREVPVFTWGAIFADREAARFRRVVQAAAQTCRLALPPDAARLLADQDLAQETFVMWDLIHDRTHMRGDLPFDPFMIKQRMPYFLYSLEELRCDLTAFRHAVRLEAEGVPHARLVQYAVVFDRIFRFPITGSRVRNYDGLGGQLLFAWLHQRHVLHWTDNRLTIDWPAVPDAVIALGDAIDDLYWRAIDRPKTVHWLEAYALIAGTLAPHPASVWARGSGVLPVDGPPKGLTDAVLADEFPLSMFYEALNRKVGEVVASTSGFRA
jgi:hypothetical protein